MLKMPSFKKKTDLEKLQERIEKLEAENKRLQPQVRPTLHMPKPKKQVLDEPVKVLTDDGQWKWMDIYGDMHEEDYSSEMWTPNSSHKLARADYKEANPGSFRHPNFNMTTASSPEQVSHQLSQQYGAALQSAMRVDRRKTGHLLQES